MSNKQGDKFEVGNMAFAPGLGWGVIDLDFGSLPRPLKWKCETGRDIWVDRFGKNASGSQVLYHANQGVIEIDTDEPVKPEDLVLDEPLEVGSPCKIQHFAGYHGGFVYCWDDGKTSHTADGLKTPWLCWSRLSQKGKQ